MVQIKLTFFIHLSFLMDSDITKYLHSNKCIASIGTVTCSFLQQSLAIDNGYLSVL